MKIAIDARLIGPEGTGIGRYLENLLINIAELDQDNEYLLLLRKNNFNFLKPNRGKFKKIVTDAYPYSIKEQVLIPAILAREQPDLVHFPHINVPLLWSGRFVLTVHDLTQREFGKKSGSTRLLPIYLIKNFGYRFVVNQSVLRSEAIFVPSNFVKAELTKTFGLPSEKIKVTYEAVDPFFVEQGRLKFSEGKIKQVLAKYGLKVPFLLYVGNLFPYKNVEVVLEALGLLPKVTNLAIVGVRNKFSEHFYRKTKDLNLTERVRLTGFVPNEELVVLYQQAESFVFPSLSEGFGLPGLEAMGVGCPVIAAKATSLPEVYGEAASYFNPRDSKELALRINSLTKEPKLRNNMVALGYQQVRKYSWKKMAEETLKVYNLVLEQDK